MPAETKTLALQQAATLQKMRSADADISRIEADLIKAKAAREVLQEEFERQQKLLSQSDK